MAATKTNPESVFPMGEAEFKQLSAHAVERTLSKGDVLWRAGDDPEAVWLVRDGRANMVIESFEGASAVVHFCTKAQAFCPAAAIAGRPYPCSAVAATDMRVVSVPRSRFMELFRHLPDFARTLLGQMAAQVCDSHCRQAMSTAPVKSRLASLLGSLNRRYAGRALPFTRQELANMSGTTVESAIRTLSQWEKSGVIESDRGSIQVRKARDLEDAVA
jgi:CRP/FNR family transcriptional regulator